MRLHQKLLKGIFHQLSVLVVWCQDHWALDILHNLLVQCSQCMFFHFSSLFSTISRDYHILYIYISILQYFNSFFIITVIRAVEDSDFEAISACFFYITKGFFFFLNGSGWLRRICVDYPAQIRILSFSFVYVSIRQQGMKKKSSPHHQFSFLVFLSW